MSEIKKVSSKVSETLKVSPKVSSKVSEILKVSLKVRRNYKSESKGEAQVKK